MDSYLFPKSYQIMPASVVPGSILFGLVSGALPEPRLFFHKEPSKILKTGFGRKKTTVSLIPQ